MDRQDLIECFQDTLRRSETQLYSETAKALESCKVYPEGFCSLWKFGGRVADIVVEEATSFAAANRWRQFGKTAVLNFANPENPGGGVRHGAMAQEECLCRSSNLYPCLAAKHVFAEYYGYHRELNSILYSDRLIYTEGVTVFKDDFPLPQPLSNELWFSVDVITCAAPYLANQKNVKDDDLKKIFKSRIRNIFEAAIANDIDVLILGAFGCGAFQNPPLVVAEAFRETIEENEYEKQFEKIIFAIKRTKTLCPNLMAFQHVFCSFSEEMNQVQSLGGS